MKRTSRLRHLALYGAVHPDERRRPTIGETRRRNRMLAAEARGLLIARLHCQASGCRETVAYLEHTPVDDPSFARSPVRLAIRAPWTREESPDGAVRSRIVLTGEVDPSTSATYFGLIDWRRSQRIELVCRDGHESRFGAGHLASRLRQA